MTERTYDLGTVKRRVFAVLGEAGTTSRTERMELASMLLQREVETYSDLSPAEWFRLCDAVVGWELVRELRRQAGHFKD